MRAQWVCSRERRIALYKQSLKKSLLNDQDLLRATVVTQGWNGYRNKSQHRKSTLEKKILLPLLQRFEPTTFWSRVRCSNHWAIPAPPVVVIYFVTRWQARVWGVQLNVGEIRCCIRKFNWFFYIFVSSWLSSRWWYSSVGQVNVITFLVVFLFCFLFRQLHI